MSTRIVKVQQPLYPQGDDRAAWLIYDHSREWETLVDAPQDLRAEVGSAPKAYFRARRKPDGEIELIERVAEQDW